MLSAVLGRTGLPRLSAVLGRPALSAVLGRGMRVRYPVARFRALRRRAEQRCSHEGFSSRLWCLGLPSSALRARQAWRSALSASRGSATPTTIHATRRIRHIPVHSAPEGGTGTWTTPLSTCTRIPGASGGAVVVASSSMQAKEPGVLTHTSPAGQVAPALHSSTSMQSGRPVHSQGPGSGPQPQVAMVFAYSYPAAQVATARASRSTTLRDLPI